MSSSSRPPRSRYHFGSRGKRPSPNRQTATTDEILASLTRQAKLMEKAVEERTLGLLEILDSEGTEELPRYPRLEPASTFEHPKGLNFGKYAFTPMLIAGTRVPLDLTQIITDSQPAELCCVTANDIESRNLQTCRSSH